MENISLTLDFRLQIIDRNFIHHSESGNLMLCKSETQELLKLPSNTRQFILGLSSNPKLPPYKDSPWIQISKLAIIYTNSKERIVLYPRVTKFLRDRFPIHEPIYLRVLSYTVRK